MVVSNIADYPVPPRASYPANRADWQVEPSRAVLLIQDMQCRFLRPYDGEGQLLSNLVENLLRLRRWARENGVPVLYTAQAGGELVDPPSLLRDIWGPDIAAADPAQQAVWEDLAPGPDDVVLTRRHYGAFHGSDLLDRMRGWRRDQLVVGGVYAHIGCMVTAVEALGNDIQPFLVGDAVADLSEAEHRLALQYVATRCGCVTDTAGLVQEPEHTGLREWLQTRVAELVEVDSVIDPNENLIFYGLDSLRIMKLSAELKQRGIVVSFEALARDPRLTAWWALIGEVRKAA